jgi:hypothetical protein
MPHRSCYVWLLQEVRMIRNDWYLRTVLTVIAVALVYLCVALTPLPAAFAQGTRVVGARTPGESTGPAEMVIVGWRLPAGVALPVDVPGGVNARVTGRVETTQANGFADRVVLAGWETDSKRAAGPGSFETWSEAQDRALPVRPSPPR